MRPGGACRRPSPAPRPPDTPHPLVPSRLLAAGVAALAALPAAAPAARHAPAPQPAAAPTPFERRKIEALLRDQLPCLGCHALGPTGGGRLGPDLADVLRRRSAAYVAAIVDDPQRVVPGTSMPRTPMPPATRALLVRYLTAGAAAAAAPTPRAAVAGADGDTSGARLYARFCAGCHGARGGGDGPNARYLPVPPAVHASRAAMAARTDDRLFDAIAAGGAPLDRSARMPAFGETLAPGQIAALVRHIRVLCGCEGPRWSTDGARSGAAGAAP